MRYPFQNIRQTVLLQSILKIHAREINWLTVSLHSIKIIELIESSQEGVFLTQLLLKTPVFELNNRFLFH